MAFVTYVLLVCVIRGLSSRFHPEVLGVTGTRALLIVFLEFALVKLGCYLLNIQGDHTVVDLVAYGGYKFVGAIVTLAVGMCGVGRLLYWGTFAYTCAANAFFLVRVRSSAASVPCSRIPASATLAALCRAARPVKPVVGDDHARTALAPHSVPLQHRHGADALLLPAHHRHLEMRRAKRLAGPAARQCTIIRSLWSDAACTTVAQGGKKRRETVTLLGMRGRGGTGEHMHAGRG
jgi:hypothetical protein